MPNAKAQINVKCQNLESLPPINIYVSEFVQLTEINKFFEARCFCPAHGIMEWWNNGMLILKENFHFLTYSLPCQDEFF